MKRVRRPKTRRIRSSGSQRMVCVTNVTYVHTFAHVLSTITRYRYTRAPPRPRRFYYTYRPGFAFPSFLFPRLKQKRFKKKKNLRAYNNIRHTRRAARRAVCQNVYGVPRALPPPLPARVYIYRLNVPYNIPRALLCAHISRISATETVWPRSKDTLLRDGEGRCSRSTIVCVCFRSCLRRALSNTCRRSHYSV